ncbi:MAG: hypothetical protein PVSMB3_07810 [Candidatus Dormibacteraceae bacterium]
MVGKQRRRIIALFIFMQALLFGATTPLGTYSVLESTFGDTSLGVLGSGWRLPNDQLAFDQVFALAGALVVAALVWRGLPFAVYSTAALAALSVLFDLIFVAVQGVSFGPFALFFLILFPLPTVPPALIALPVLILCISVIRDERRARRKAAPVPPPAPEPARP